jgi:hypothetical protein
LTAVWIAVRDTAQIDDGASDIALRQLVERGAERS